MDKKEDQNNQDPKPDKSIPQDSKKANEKDILKDCVPEPDKMLNEFYVGSVSGTKDVGTEEYMNLDSEIKRNGSKRPNNVTVIKGNKKPKKDETEANFENLESNFRKLDENLIRFTKTGKRIEGLEARIHALMHEGEDKAFENNETEPMRFWEWQKEFDLSDNNKETLNNLKNRAEIEGYNLSSIILDVTFFMSYEYYDQMLKTFGVLENSLKWIIQRESSVVIHRILEILRTIDITLRNKNRSEKLKRPSNGEDLVFVDDIIFKILEEIFRLELFWMHRGLPVSQDLFMLIILSLEVDIDQCEIKLYKIGSDIIKLFDQFSTGLNADEVKECEEYEEVNDQIIELWDVVWD